GRARGLARVEQVRSPEGQEPRSRQPTSQPCNSPPRIAVEAFDGDQALLERVDEPCERTDLLGGDALEVERPHEDLPTAVQLADEVRARDLHVVEEDLAEVAAAERGEAPHLDPGRVDRRHENGDPAVPRLLRVGTDREIDPIREPRARGPDLVAVDDEAIRLDARTGGERREVAPRSGFRKALAEHESAARD